MNKPITHVCNPTCDSMWKWLESTCMMDKNSTMETTTFTFLLAKNQAQRKKHTNVHLVDIITPVQCLVHSVICRQNWWEFAEHCGSHLLAKNTHKNTQCSDIFQKEEQLAYTKRPFIRRIFCFKYPQWLLVIRGTYLHHCHASPLQTYILPHHHHHHRSQSVM